MTACHASAVYLFDHLFARTRHAAVEASSRRCRIALPLPPLEELRRRVIVTYPAAVVARLVHGLRNQAVAGDGT